MRALEQMGDAAGELDVLEAAGHLAGGVAQHLAVLGRDGRGQIGGGPGHEVTEAEEDVGPGAEGAGAPLGGRLVGDLDRAVDLGRGRQRHGRRLHAAGRVEDRARGGPRSPPPTSPRRSARVQHRNPPVLRAPNGGLPAPLDQLGQLLGDQALVLVEVAPGRPRAPAAPHEEDEHGEDAMPTMQTVHQRFHSPGEVFWAGTSFCSANSRLARFGEYLATPAIWARLTGLPF